MFIYFRVLAINHGRTGSTIDIRSESAVTRLVSVLFVCFCDGLVLLSIRSLRYTSPRLFSSLLSLVTLHSSLLYLFRDDHSAIAIHPTNVVMTCDTCDTWINCFCGSAELFVTLFHPRRNAAVSVLHK